MDVILFLVFATIAVVCAVSLVVQKRGRSLAVQLLGVPGFFGLLALLSYAILRLFPNAANVHFGGFTNGKAEDVGRALFTRYLLPFEVTSVLILIAIIGAIVLARKEL